LKLNTEEEFKMFQQGVHFDKELEKIVLGTCLLEPKAFSRIYNMLEEDILYDPFSRVVFGALKDMFESGDLIDLITVANHLRKNKITEYSGDNVPYLLTGMMQNVVSSAHLEVHSLILRELYLDRELTRISHSKFDGDAIEKAEKIQAAIKKALTVQGSDDWRTINEVMISLEKHRAKVKGKTLMGVPTGFRTLDLITGGYQEGQVIVIAARPSVGKSAFIGGIAVNAAKEGFKIGVISLEMPEEQIGARLASLYSDIEFYKIYQNKTYDANEERRLIESMTNIGSLPIFITDKTNVTSGAIRAKAEKLKARNGLDLLIIDYLQLIETNSSSNREREIAILSRSLKLMAMDLKIPVIILCQLNRDSEKQGSSKKPKMSQIRESGSIEQDADVVMLLHRDWKSGLKEDEKGSTEFRANIIVEKNRNGETTDLEICFNPETMKFYEEEQKQVSGFTAPSIEPVYTDGIRQAKQTVNWDDPAPF